MNGNISSVSKKIPLTTAPKGRNARVVSEQVRLRIIELYKTMTLVEVHVQIAIEFPKTKPSKPTIRKIINDEKVRLVNEQVNSMIDGSYEEAEAIRTRVRHDLMDKRSRLKRGLEKIIDDQLKDIFDIT